MCFLVHIKAHAVNLPGMALLCRPFLFIMAKEFAEAFYNSKAWKDCRRSYAKSKQNLCEVCLAKGLYTPAEIVHHKIHLTPTNINDPSISLNWDNLQCVCRECHAAAHGSQKRWRIDENGRVISKI